MELSRQQAERQRLRDREYDQQDKAWINRKIDENREHMERLELECRALNARLDHLMDKLAMGGPFV